MNSPSPWDDLLTHAPNLDTDRLDRYAAELEHWNQRIRLVGPRDLAGIRHQIADALLPFLLLPPRFPLLDLGSGAGLPGVPIAIAFTDAPVVCLEPLPKRVSFLRHIRRALGLQAMQVAPYRVEDAIAADTSLGAAFLTTTARAVAGISTLLVSMEPFLDPEGAAILLRGDEPGLTVPGWGVPTITTYSGPDGSRSRTLHVYGRNPTG